MNKTLIVFLIIALAVLSGVVGYMYGRVSQEEVPQTPEPTVGTAGDINTTVRKDEIGIDRSTTTPASLYNEDARDREITKVYGYLQNLNDVTSSPLVLQAATSSAQGVGADQNTNYILDTVACALAFCDIATSSEYTTFASSTPEVSGAYLTTQSDDTGVFIWPAGTYINFFMYSTNTPTSNATDTVTGLFGIEYREVK